MKNVGFKNILTVSLFAAAIALTAQARTSAEPIQIGALEDLLKIGASDDYPLNGSYELTADIDASPTRGLNGGAGFEPIGRRVSDVVAMTEVIDTMMAFRGTFNGGGHVISGLYINRPTAADGMSVGLFGYAHNADIRNVTVIADSVIGYRYVGALVGGIGGAAAEISGCHVRGVVVGFVDVGGLAGTVERGAAVTASYTLATVSGTERVGGLAGINEGGRISNSYSLSSVTGGNDVGGFAGLNAHGLSRITNSYSAGAISVIWGGGDGSGGDFAPAFNIGGFAGRNDAVIVNCQWDTQRSGISDGTVTGSMTGRTTDQMRRAASFGAWGFHADSAWGMSNNYPYLRAFPVYAMTFRASNGGGTVAADSDTAAGGSVFVQIVNFGVDGGGVRADLADIGEEFEGWEIVSGADNAVLTLSDDSLTISFSELTGDVEAVARFVIKTYDATYAARAGGTLLVTAHDDDTDTIAAGVDTFTVRVEHGAAGPRVTAVPDTGFFFARWLPALPNFADTARTRVDTLYSDTAFTASFSTSTVTLIYVGDSTGGGDDGLVRVLNAPNSGVSHRSVTWPVPFDSIGPVVEARPAPGKTATHRFVEWSDGVTDNPRTDSLVRYDMEVYAIFEVIPVSIASTGRDVPVDGVDNEPAAVALPVSMPISRFSAGPNPASGSSPINFYMDRHTVTTGTLLIFDALGNTIRRIPVNSTDRRIASWDLTDNNGRQVSPGTYLIRGTLTDQYGRKESVLMIIGVR